MAPPIPLMSFPGIIQGSSFVLRPPREDEAETYRQWFVDVEVTRWLAFDTVPSLEFEVGWVKDREADNDSRGWCIEVDGYAVGLCGLDMRERDGHPIRRVEREGVSGRQESLPGVALIAVGEPARHAVGAEYDRDRRGRWRRHDLERERGRQAGHDETHREHESDADDGDHEPLPPPLQVAQCCSQHGYSSAPSRSRTGVPVPFDRRIVAVALADQVGAALAMNLIF